MGRSDGDEGGAVGLQFGQFLLHHFESVGVVDDAGEQLFLGGFLFLLETLLAEVCVVVPLEMGLLQLLGDFVVRLLVALLGCYPLLQDGESQMPPVVF